MLFCCFIYTLLYSHHPSHLFSFFSFLIFNLTLIYTHAFLLPRRTYVRAQEQLKRTQQLMESVQLSRNDLLKEVIFLRYIGLLLFDERTYTHVLTYVHVLT